MMPRSGSDISGKNGNNKATPAESMSPTVMWKHHQSGNMARPLVEPGREVREILMRTNLLDSNEARDVARCLDFMEEFGLDEEKNIILNLLAAKVSVKGMGRMEFTMALTGIFDPRPYGYKYDKNMQSQNQNKQNV